MSLPFTTLDHIGFAVKNLDEAIATYTQRLGFTLDERETLKDRNIELAFVSAAESTIELIAPFGKGESPIDSFLNTRGPGLHHLCYEVPDLQAALELCKKDGFELIDESPRPGARGAEIAFVHPRSIGGLLLELCHYRR